MFGQRILILVPHPDDEVVASAAAIGRAQQGGSQIFTLYLTHGCIAQDAMWPWQRKHYDFVVERRRAEAEHVARVLNLTPVGWSPRPARMLWQQMNSVRDEIQQAITAHAIDQLWLPAYEGGNPDHDALNAIGQIFRTKGIGEAPLPLAGGAGGGLVNRGLVFASPPLIPPASGGDAHAADSVNKDMPPVLEFAEYNFAGGKAHAQMFPFPNGTEQSIDLTEAERKSKRKALTLYVSEKANLNYVRVERESFRPLAAYDYSQPPHPGTLWYARFQWVPFRHPRVDFTEPAEVSTAITGFFDQKRQK